jgi:hypothetical protein
MKTDEQAGREYLDALKKTIEQMEPVERACSMLLVQLGRIVAELLTRHDWQPIEEMEKVCDELFAEARRIKDEMKNVQ